MKTCEHDYNPPSCCPSCRSNKNWKIKNWKILRTAAWVTVVIAWISQIFLLKRVIQYRKWWYESLARENKYFGLLFNGKDKQTAYTASSFDANKDDYKEITPTGTLQLEGDKPKQTE